MIKKELLRKSIHFSGILYIPFYNIFGVEILSLGFVALLLIASLFEILRLKKAFLQFVVRDYEQSGIGAYFYFLLAFALITPIFSKDATFIAISAAIVGDGFAGILRSFGKDWIASAVMFLSSLSLIYFLELLDLFSFSAIFVATIVERIKEVASFRLEDNFTVPVAAACVYSVKYIFHT